MVESISNDDLKIEMLGLFIDMFKKFHSIPISILCDPLFKQLQINMIREEEDPIADMGTL